MNTFKASTNRFILRTLIESDATIEYLSWLSPESKLKFIEHKPKEISELVSYINQFKDNPLVYFLAIIDQQSRQHIGNVKYIFKNNDFKEVEMGILIGNERYRGIGVAAEIIHYFADYSVKKFNTKIMTLGVDIKNTPAIKAYEKIGFKTKKMNPNVGIIMNWDLTELNKN
jgi:[ribosomal protein S5]-alanine N-acetyltransferase